MNIDNYLKQLTIDIDNQKLQETILNKYAKTTTFDFKIKNMTQSNPTQVSSFLKNDIIDKLNRLVDSVTAMRVYNFLISNNLMDTFLKSYEYLLNYKNYNVMSYNVIINYILSYASSSKGMLDFLKEDLKEKLKSKTDISQLKQLNKITTNANVKNKIKIASQKIPTQEKINKVQNIDILQQMINDAEFLPDKAQLDKILSRTRRTKPEMKEAEGFEDIRSLEKEQTKLESQFPLEYSEKVTTESPMLIPENKQSKPKQTRRTKKQKEEADLMALEDIRSLEKKGRKKTPQKKYQSVVFDVSVEQLESQYEKQLESQYEKQIFTTSKFDDPEDNEILKQNYIDKYNIGVNNEIQIDNKEFDIIMEELNKKSQFEEQESFQNLSQQSNISEEEFSQDFENLSQGFENIISPIKSQEEFEIPFETVDLENFEFREKTFSEKLDESFKTTTSLSKEDYEKIIEEENRLKDEEVKRITKEMEELKRIKEEQGLGELSKKIKIISLKMEDLLKTIPDINNNINLDSKYKINLDFLNLKKYDETPTDDPNYNKLYNNLNNILDKIKSINSQKKIAQENINQNLEIIEYNKTRNKSQHEKLELKDAMIQNEIDVVKGNIDKINNQLNNKIVINPIKLIKKSWMCSSDAIILQNNIDIKEKYLDYLNIEYLDLKDRFS